MALYDVSTNEKKAAPSLVAGGTLYADSPIGTILPFGGSTAPSGFMICDGTAVSRTNYSELFAVIGESFGAGDGSTTFNLPDMAGKTAVGVSSSVALGTSEAGALPNIKGSLMGRRASSTAGFVAAKTTGSGAFTDNSSDVPGSSVRYGSTINDMGTQNQIDFDASTYNSIYKDGLNQVTPANVRVNYIIKAKMTAVPADFLSAVDEAVAKSITVKKGTWEGSITLQKMGDAQTRDRFDIPITFDSPMPDTNYTVVIEFFEGRYVTVRSATKTASGFHIEGANCDNNTTSTVTKITWTAIRFPS